MYAMDSIYGKDTVNPEAPPKSIAKSVEPNTDDVNPKKVKKEEKASEAPAAEASLISRLDIAVGKILDVKRHPYDSCLIR